MEATGKRMSRRIIRKTKRIKTTPTVYHSPQASARARSEFSKHMWNEEIILTPP